MAMESVTFVYCLATEKEKQTEALKNKGQSQLDKYRTLIQKQMKKERAFLSYKKTEFLSRQEAKLGGKRRSLSARARMGNHFGMVVASSKPRSSNISPEEGRKSCVMASTGSNSPVISKPSEAKRTRVVPVYKNSTPLTIEGPKQIENKTVWKRWLALPKGESPQNELTKAQKGRDCRNLKEKESKERVSIDCSRKNDTHSFGKAETTAATKPSEGSVSWAVVTRLIGLKTTFKRRRLHGTFQAPELEMLDPSLKNYRRFSQAKPNDPWDAVKGCRYLRMPTRNDT